MTITDPEEHFVPVEAERASRLRSARRGLAALLTFPVLTGRSLLQDAKATALRPH